MKKATLFLITLTIFCLPITIHANSNQAPMLTNEFNQKFKQPLVKNRYIYYRIHGAKKGVNAWNYGIKKWNSLKVIQFKKAPQAYRGYVINLYSNQNSQQDKTRLQSSDVVGNTKTESELKLNNWYYTKTNVYLSYRAQHNQNINPNLVTIHELGHVLSFTHDTKYFVKNHKKLYVVMNPYTKNNVKSLGNYEKKSLKQYYNIK